MGSDEAPSESDQEDVILRSGAQMGATDLRTPKQESLFWRDKYFPDTHIIEVIMSSLKTPDVASLQAKTIQFRREIPSYLRSYR